MMSFTRNYEMKGGTYHDGYWPSSINSFSNNNYRTRNRNSSYFANYDCFHGNSREIRDLVDNFNFEHMKPNDVPSMKRRKYSSSSWGAYDNASLAWNNRIPLPARINADASTSSSGKRERSRLEDDEVVFMSRDEIERLSPSRKDGIDALRETQLRYSYCAFLQDLGLRLDLPQTTIGTAMVLCHRFFVRRSHACHDRFLIATAALFLAAKSEETPRPLNNVLRASCEIFHKQDISFLSYLLPVDWFERYRERVTEAEQLILTTLNFELNVQHPYTPLTSTLNKLGLSQGVLLNLALNLISEGLRSSLWLQFKPHQIAAGAAYLAAKFLNMDLASYHSIWQEFQVTPSILQDVAQQLMELF
ncbi:cyclin-T1-4-like isoform X2 [Rhodamnia argentea]|uniref:Cyclin-T1-4-like isoform X2 n=1 Tax=Rhodamnia argentea TaxID=178133 RepID=A0A8B8QNU0_9MYRT|nr:cyclin-T1-4-like isoform X2 [Rhodamnia argentea]